MLRIRLSRVGKKKQPSYRLLVTDSRAPRDGAFVKIIGHYNPRTEPATLVVNEDEAVEWLRRGAKPSETVGKLLTRIGVMERAGRAPVTWDRKTPVKPKKAKEEAPAEAAAAETPAEPTTAPEPQPEPEAAAAEAPAEPAAAPEPQPEAETGEDTEAKAEEDAKATAAEEQPEPPPAEAATEAEGESTGKAEAAE